MLRLWGVWIIERGTWWMRRNLFSAKQDAVNRAAVMSFKCEAKPFGDFLQVTPEVREAVKALKSGALTGNPFDAEIARGDILNWALAGIPEEQGDANSH